VLVAITNSATPAAISDDFQPPVNRDGPLTDNQATQTVSE